MSRFSFDLFKFNSLTFNRTYLLTWFTYFDFFISSCLIISDMICFNELDFFWTRNSLIHRYNQVEDGSGSTSSCECKTEDVDQKIKDLNTRCFFSYINFPFFPTFYSPFLFNIISIIFIRRDSIFFVKISLKHFA